MAQPSGRAAARALAFWRVSRRAHSSDTPGAIFRSSRANKTGLSHALDGAMRDGSHDMRVFGTGTLAALASRSAYASFTAAHYHFYAELEARLDDAARGPAPTPTGALWSRFGSELRRAPALEADLATLLDVETPAAMPPTPATEAYIRAIADAYEREAGEPRGATATATATATASADPPPPLLLAHFYTRYLADLFGGSMLGWPTRRALGFPRVPRFYVHDVFERASGAVDRAAYVESVYEAINAVGAGLSERATAEVAAEAKRAFKLNAEVYAEGRGSSRVAAAAGGARVMWGYAKERVWGAREQRDLFGRLVARRDPKTGEFAKGEQRA